MIQKNLTEFQYFVLNTAEKWQQGICDSVQVDSQDHLALAGTEKFHPTGLPEKVAGIAPDSSGNLFLIDSENCQVLKYNTSQQSLEAMACFGGCGIASGRFLFQNKTGHASGRLANGHRILYITDSFNHRIQAFYLSNFQVRFVLGKVAQCQPVSGTRPGEFNQPTDIVVDTRGYFYVLDFGNQRIQKFDCFGRFNYFIGSHGEHALIRPVSLTIDKENFLYILDAETKTIEKFNHHGQWIKQIIDFNQFLVPLKRIGEPNENCNAENYPIIPVAIAVGNEGQIFVGEQAADCTLHIYQFDEQGNFTGRFGLYQKTCHQLIVNQAGQLWGICGSGYQVINFTGTSSFAPVGIYYSPTFNSKIEDCHWHRIALEFQDFEQARFQIFARAADEKNELDTVPWQLMLTSPSLEESVISGNALFPETRGQYLQLKFEFRSEGQQTYRIKTARIFFERQSYLRYLPAVYQEDSAGRAFLEKFLSIFESLNYDIEQQIQEMVGYFDPYGVPSDFFAWLGGWLAILTDQNWPEAKLRKLLENAFRLYGLRGTIPGLKQMIEIFTEETVTILEHFHLKAPLVIGAHSRIGTETVVGKGFTKRLILEESSTIGGFVLNELPDEPEKVFEADAYDFTIFANTTRLDAPQEKALQRLVQAEKPAHTRCYLRTSSEAEMQLGFHAFLEVDTRLSKGFKPIQLGVRSLIGKNTYPDQKFQHKGTIEQRSQIAIDAILH